MIGHGRVVELMLAHRDAGRVDGGTLRAMGRPCQ
jgi:hypothetical protein